MRAYLKGRLIPYVSGIVDRGIDKASRVADTTISVAKKSMLLNFPAKVIIETVDVLKNYGLAGFAGLMLRKDFMESVETLKKISGMDKMFTFSLHELTACVYYKLAIERGLRGCEPDSELKAHQTTKSFNDADIEQAKICNTSYLENKGVEDQNRFNEQNIYCGDARDSDIENSIRLAPLALKIVYEETAFDCQRLAKTQGWETIFTNIENELEPEQPCYALFATSHDVIVTKGSRKKEAILAVRGTKTIQDVVTDIRATPQEFPPSKEEVQQALDGSCAVKINSTDREDNCGIDDDDDAWEWLVFNHEESSFACGGMARAALFLLKDVAPSLLKLYVEGYDVVVVGHSLGGAVAALVTYLLKPALPSVRCITYGCPSCVDATISDELRKSVLSVVLRDDVISRITPQSIRLMMRELMVFREEIFKHLKQDWDDVIDRSISLWSPRWRNPHGGFEVNYRKSGTRKEHTKTNIAAQCENFTAMASAATNSDSNNNSNNNNSNNNNRDNNVNDYEKTQDSIKDISSSVFNSVLSALQRKQQNGLSNNNSNDNVNSFDNEGEETSYDIVPDAELPSLWLPGRIIHIYSHKGQYKAAEVSREFVPLRRIEIQGGIFNDHRSKDIFDALLEVRAVRKARSEPPLWTPYGASSFCECCHNSFTWHSTFRGQAQEYRERYNCRNCGSLVCGPCSESRRAIPKFGLIFPRRICDKCENTGDYSC